MPKRSFKYARWTLLVRMRLLAMTGRRGQRASTRDPSYETRMELTVKALTDGTYETVKAVAMTHKMSKSPKILGDPMLHHRFPARRSVTV
jgi:hypothetical protein